MKPETETFAGGDKNFYKKELIIKGQATFIKAFRRSRFVTISDIKLKFTYFYHEVKPQKHTEYFDMSHLTTSIVYFTLVVCLGEYTCA